MLIEGCGAQDEVLKLMPALTIDLPLLREGLGILESALEAVLGDSGAKAVPMPHLDLAAISPSLAGYDGFNPVVR